MKEEKDFEHVTMSTGAFRYERKKKKKMLIK